MAEINGLTPLAEQTYGELEAAVIREAPSPMEPAEAQKVVDAVLGPLKLLPPRLRDAPICYAAYFSHEGEWQDCVRDHDEDLDDPETHQESGGFVWDDGDFRSIPASYDTIPEMVGD